MAGIEEGLADATSSAIGFTPKILAAIVVLVIGLIIGRIVGRVVARILETAKVNTVIEETPLGDMISHSGMNMLEFLDALARWFIYLIFIMAAVNILDIDLFSQFLERTVDYLPSFIAGIIILIIGLAIADFSVNWLKSIIKSMNLKGGEHLEAGIRVFLFLVIVLLSLDQMRVDTSIIRLFLGPFAWALAVILIFRWGVSESLTVYAKAKK